MNLIDCHNHSSYSFDADDSVSNMVSAARNKGIFAFAITDHCEVNEYSDRNHPAPIVGGISEIIRLRELPKYKDIKLIAGVELGQPLYDNDLANQILSLQGLDFVIGSLHCVPNEQDYYFIDFNKLTNDEVDSLNYRYYTEMLNVAKYADFDILAHITYPFRYMRKAMAKNSNLNFSFDRYDDQIYEILKTIVQRGKGIEINTSTFKSIGETMPAEKFIKQYYDLGGEILSIGSDSHEMANVGNAIDIGHIIAHNAGFQYVTYYQNRKPEMVSIN